ncbi:MAG TPA: aminodeoxychorismate synthase component I [Pyrinomonadaceae bacterium]
MREIKLAPDELVRRLLSIETGRRLSLLDSCGVAGARLLIAGFDPFETIEVCGRQPRVVGRNEAEPRVIDADALSLLDERLKRHASSSEGEFLSGACIATLSYELAHQLERLRSNSHARHEQGEPDAVFAFYDALVVHDYAWGKSFIVSRDEERADETEAALLAARPLREPLTHGESCAGSNMTREEYLAAVLRIKEHIAAGDIYQANLTQQLSCALPQEIEAEHLFLRLRRQHPSPFAAFIRRREDAVVSISPERFLRVEPQTKLVEAWPIKGTRRRGVDEQEDALLRRELLSSEKDRAENVMIVDLLRNDLGRVCHYGSVEVAELCRLEEHPTLFHLVSKVRGALRDEVTAGELLRACFPCGSITGAPKIRAMEIIDEVETAPRGLSMGAIGYFGFDGSLDLSVAIRTMTVRERVARFNVGGGIVADSDPALEYEESLIKARALLRALGVKH